ncbi:S9 family peptidase [Sphingomonas astaxanthinifaciens]|uniref:Peptidase S9 family protein n=1 Tax=Sphingomonas astaxanthinifaciens DSM 22298 TaxID=1123267 RepID=A0ABQ5Z8D0_9SPHN|nr:prolyl oligopeptidase family serine peptidase [Sphingomonas astaxanthinifaciens]GLR48229.1 peptidase S9 family protein [Sphingomonas astaxanthinifaciens DSM 22298]
MLIRFSLALAATSALAGVASAQAPDTVPKPAALTVQGVPPVPAALAARTRPYQELRSAAFAGWNKRDRSMLIRTRFGNVPQLHRVAGPLMDRQQISFEAEPVSGSWAPSGDVLAVQKDRGGDEFFQLYRLDGGRLTLLTDGKSRNERGAWSKDGKLLGYSSTRRNGTDTDLYVVDPRNPASDRRVAEVKGGGWSIAAFAPGNARALVLNYQQVTNSDPYLLDVASGRLTPIGDLKKDIAIGGAEFAPNGKLWVLSDEDSDVQRLGTLDPATGRFTPVANAGRWDVEEFDISDDGRRIAYLTNEAGISRLYILDTASGRSTRVAALPVGVAGGIEWAPWGELGFTFNSAKGTADAWSYNPATAKLTRWTRSETGGLDFSANPEAQLFEVKSFDGERVSGFLYRPDPAKFPGKRPVIVDIHGGPEGQERPGFMGRDNYLINELGIAVFLPNVRGSTGFGKRFVSLDNGPFKREDSVKDIGAFLTALKADPAIDANRMAVTGGSYGGYMCYASAIRYAADFKGALCNVAISNFVTFLENTQSYRRDLRRVEYGDERDPTQRAKLEEISPLRRINEIKEPLFVVQGANDPRVPKSEADQLVAKVRAQGTPVWYMVGENEGHGFGKKENQDYLFWSTLQFWQQTLLK